METVIGVDNTAHCTIGHVSPNSRDTEYFRKQHKPDGLCNPETERMFPERQGFGFYS
jgi:hypothetical protein